MSFVKPEMPLVRLLIKSPFLEMKAYKPWLKVCHLWLGNLDDHGCWRVGSTQSYSRNVLSFLLVRSHPIPTFVRSSEAT